MTVEVVARRSYGRLIAFLAARTGDVSAAEDALSDAFASALVDWPRNGCPSNPEAWLLTVARRKFIDTTRRRDYGWEPLASTVEAVALDTNGEQCEIPDRRLALLLVCAHPAIEEAVRAPLMLQTVLGLDAKTIASVFLTSPAAMSKRLVRAKEKIRQLRIPFEIPGRDELSGRVGSLLDAIYAAFGEGWNDAAGTDAARRDLAEEAIFLARLAVELVSEEAEAIGLLSFMLYAEARRNARRNKDGEYVPFAEQDRARWDMEMIAEAERLLRRASEMRRPGRYQWEAVLQSAHVYRGFSGEENWEEILAIYEELRMVAPTPIVAVNRAVVVGKVYGAAAGLRELQLIAGDARLAEYQPMWAAKAALLAEAGSDAEAFRAYERAIGLERDPAVRRFLQGRQATTARR